MERNAYFNDKARVEQISQTLWDVFLGGCQIPVLLETSASFLRCPVLFKGEDIYSAAFDGPVPFDTSVSRQLFSWIESTCKDTNHAVWIKQVPDEVMQETGMREAPYGLLCYIVAVHQQPLGCLVAFGIDHPFRAGDQELMATVSRMLAMLSGSDMEKFFIDNKGIPYAALFHALLHGEPSAPALIEEYTATLPQKAERDISVLVIEARQSTTEAKMRSLRDACLSMVTCSVRVLYRGCVVLLYHGRRKYTLEEHYNFIDFLRKNDCICGQSRTVSDLLQISKYYNQAKTAAQLGVRLFPDRTVFSYECVVPYHAIQLAGVQIGLDEMVSPQLQRLLDYDESKGGGLLETLRVYLNHINNLNQAAEILNIHRNTLFYRLRKIEDITGWDLDQGSCLQDILFSLRVLDIRNLA